MSKRVPILIVDGRTRELVEATLLHDVTNDELDRTDQSWKGYLSSVLDQMMNLGIDRSSFPEHKHWEWYRKGKAILPSERIFGIEFDNQMQGLMIVRDNQRSRTRRPANALLTYIDYLAAAPWNDLELLKNIGSYPRFRRIGSAFMRIAIELSQEQGNGGRIGLHSLPQAEAFYREKCSMDDFGIDRAYENLRYFEMSPENANKFIGGEL